MQDQHHPFCNTKELPRRGCQHCGYLFATYPVQPGETSAEATARYFPSKRGTAPEARKADDLVMVQRGREVVTATAPMVEAHSVAVKAPLAEIEELLRQRNERLMRLANRKAVEATRMAKARDAAESQVAKRTGQRVIETGGHRRLVRRVNTTIGKMEKDGKLPADLAVHVYAFARRVAEGFGVATEDEHDATNRLTGPYSPVATLSGFGSKTLGDRQLNGLTALKLMSRRVPDEMKPIFTQIIEEEIIGQSRVGRTLAELGEALGYKHKQQIPAGGALVYATVALIAHFMRESPVVGGDHARSLRTLEA